MHILRKPWGHLLVITFFVLLAYSNTLNSPFIFDDLDNIVNNPSIKSLHNFVGASDLDNINNPLVFYNPLLANRYIGYLSFALNYAVHGLDVRGYHLVNILIHLCVSFLVYALITATFKTPFFQPNGTERTWQNDTREFIALFTALLFAVHPVQTQAVTYIVQRFASLATLFWLISLLSYIEFRMSTARTTVFSKRPFLYALSLLSTALSMKTKEFAILLPIIIALYEVMFLEGKTKKRLLYLAPFCLTMVIVPLSLIFTSGKGLVTSATLRSISEGGISRLDYLLTQFRVIVTYIRLLFFPVNQTLDYDYPIFQSFFTPVVALSFLFLLLIFLTGVYLYCLSRRPECDNRHLYRLVSFGIFWFFITLSVESSIFPIEDVIFEHRLYLPSIGFLLSLVSGMAAYIFQLSPGKYLKAALVATTLVIIAALTATTYARNAVWKENTSLWEDIASKSPKKARVHANLCQAYLDDNRLDDAESACKTALQLGLYYPVVYKNLGDVYLIKKQPLKAVSFYRMAIKYDPNFTPAQLRIGIIYHDQGLLEDAVKEYKKINLHNNNIFAAHYNLGLVYYDLGQYDDAIKEYAEALRLDASYAPLYNSMGIVYFNLGSNEKAVSMLNKSLQLDPDNVSARSNLQKILQN